MRGSIVMLMEETADGSEPSPQPASGWGVAAALGLALDCAGAYCYGARRGQWSAPQPLVRLNVDLGPDAVAGQFTTTAISPDGSRLVFPVKSPDGKQMLATRLLERDQAGVALGNRERKRPVLFA